MKLTLAFTTWNSAGWISKQIEKDYFTLSNGIIDEIIIQDDNSADYELIKHYQTYNIKIYQNNENLSPLLCRRELVRNCKNEWILLMDCDNFLIEKSEQGIDIFSLLQSLPLKEDTIYCPGFKGHWGYRHLCDTIIDYNFVNKYIQDPEYYLQIFLNTGNYFIPKLSYLETCNLINPSFCHYAVDVIYFNYLWLKSGKKLYCVSDYEYEHTIRTDNTSYTITHGERSRDKLTEIINLYKMPLV